MKFIWREKLTVIISEMSRAAALDCSRDLGEVPIGDDEQTFARALEGCVVRYAPAVVIVDGQIYRSGPVKVEYSEGELLEFTLPLDTAGLNKLPVTLASVWIEAAEQENQFVVDGLKNVLSLVTTNALEPQPGNAS